MFFNKTEHKISVTPQNIGILGTSAQALYWADVFQNLGHHVCLLCSPQKADEYNATDFTFKDSSRLRSPRNNFFFCHELAFKPQIFFLASSPEHQRSELTLLSPEILSDSVVISFLFSEHDALLPEIIKKPIINGYFEGWINQSQNHVNIYGHSPKVIFSLSDTSEEAKILAELFTPTDITTIFSEDNKTNFWNFTAPRIVYSLLSIVHEQNIFQLAKTENGRKRIDTLLAEIKNLAASDNVILTEATLLTKLYEIPSAWISPLQKSIQNQNFLYFDRLSSFIADKSGRNDKKYPLLHELLRQIYNKY